MLRTTSWCSGYHCCTTSFIKAWTQVLRRLNPAREDLWKWYRLEIRLRLSSVNHTTKTIHHQHHHHHRHHNRIIYKSENLNRINGLFVILNLESNKYINTCVVCGLVIPVFYLYIYIYIIYIIYIYYIYYIYIIYIYMYIERETFCSS